MTKINNKFKIYKRYQEDFWGFLYFTRKKSKITKNIFKSFSWNKSRIDPRYLDIKISVPFRKKRFFKNAFGKSSNMLTRFLNYLINLNINQLKKIFKSAKFTKNSYRKSFALWVETRIDSLLLKLNLFYSKGVIKNWINKKKILINLKPINSANINVNIGDIISFSKKDKIFLWSQFKKKYFTKFTKKNKKYFKLKGRKWNRHDIPYFFPPYLDLNYRLFFFSLWRAPLWEEIPFLTSFNLSHIFGNNKIR